MWKRMPKGKKIFLFGFITYVIFLCGTYVVWYFHSIDIDNPNKSVCPKGQHILTFHDNDDISIKLWSYINIWAISKSLPKWHPYAPFKILELLSLIFDDYIKFDDFSDLSEDCRLYGDTDPHDFIKLNFNDDPYKFAHLIFLHHHKLRDDFLFSEYIRDQVSTFIGNELERLQLAKINVNTFVMIVLNKNIINNNIILTNNNNKLKKKYTTAMKKIMTLSQPLFIIIGDKNDSKDLMKNERVVMVPKNFDISHELYLATQCRYLIIDGSLMSMLYSVFSFSDVHIYKPRGQIRELTGKLKNWHHYE